MNTNVCTLYGALKPPRMPESTLSVRMGPNQIMCTFECMHIIFFSCIFCVCLCIHCIALKTVKKLELTVVKKIAVSRIVMLQSAQFRNVRKCEYNWKCLGFSWQVRGGSQNQKCILYWKRKPDDIPNENVKQIFCQLPIPNHNLACPNKKQKSIQIGRKHTVSGDGLDKNNKTAESSEACRLKCRAKNKCQAFSWEPDSKKCTIFGPEVPTKAPAYTNFVFCRMEAGVSCKKILSIFLFFHFNCQMSGTNSSSRRQKCQY